MSARGTDVSDMKRFYRTANIGEFPEYLDLTFEKESDLRYGENPMQPASVYRFKESQLAKLTNIRLAKTGKGGISATNFMDVTRAMDILKYFKEPSVAVMKHLIPSGFATQHNSKCLAEIYKKARDADARSAFGSVVVFNQALDKDSANALLETFVEAVAAPEYESGVIEMLETKKDLRVMLYSNLDKLPKFIGDDTLGLYDMKALPTGRLIFQKPYLTSIKSREDLILDPMINGNFVKRDPTDRELKDMLTAWYVNFGVRSNGIVLVKNGVTVAIGSGQQERVGAVEQAIIKAYQKYNARNGIKFEPLHGVLDTEGLFSFCPDLQGAVCSSDAFFPFRDSVDVLGNVGVSAIIEPGGSVKDQEVIEAVNEKNMAMAFTRERCFGHF